MSVFDNIVRSAGCGILAAAMMATGAQAADKVRFLTNWYAQAEHGGFYQAKATGLYEEAGLDVEISMGGPQVNVMQLLVAGEADIILGYDLQVLSSIEQGLPVVAIATTFQHDLRCILTRSDVQSLADLGDKTILVASGGMVTWWPWVKATYGFTDEQVRPYTFNLQPFFSDPDIAQQCFISSEPMQAENEGVDHNVFLLAEQGWPPYGNPIVTTRQFLEENPDVVRRFVEASMKGWSDYVRNPEPANELIKEDNPNMNDEQIAFGIAQFKKFNVLADADGRIGTISQDRWRQTYEFMVEAEMLGADVDWQSAFTTDVADQIQVALE